MISLDPKHVTAVLLHDGWHDTPKGVTFDSCAHLGNGVMSYKFTDDTGSTLVGPIAAVQAVKTSS